MAGASLSISTSPLLLVSNRKIKTHAHYTTCFLTLEYNIKDETFSKFTEVFYGH
jgi:hypothetical protein